MKPRKTWKLTSAGVAASLSLLSTLPAAVITLENFSGVANGTALTSVPNWSLQSGSPNEASVLDSAGYSGPGGNIANITLYKYAIPTAYTMTVGSDTIGYSIKFQLSSLNNYQQAQILLGKNDGVNGLAVIFNGGTSNVDSDNYISLSSGGTNWGSITYNNVASSAWSANDWYQIDFTNISLVSAGYGSAVSGKVTITNITDQTVLVNNQTITGFGNSGVFNTIDSLVVGNKATSRSIHFDDITATTVPEPTTATLAVLALTALAWRTRHRVKRSAQAGALLAAGVLASSVSAQAAFEETFSTSNDGSFLKEAEGWSLHFGDDGNALINLSAGYAGQGTRIEQNEQYRRVIPEDQALFIEEGNPGTFRSKVRISAPNDGYTLAQVLVGADDGVHGLAVRFNGGERDGHTDNFIQVSRGGENWGKISFADFKEAGWQKDTWYELIISDILPEAGSNVVRGKLTIREADDAKNVLLDGVSIESTGSTGRFVRMDTVVIGNCGTSRAFDVDDISLTSGSAN